MKLLAALALFVWLLGTQAEAQPTAAEPKPAVNAPQRGELKPEIEQLNIAERAIEASTQEEYAQAREVLAKRALELAEKDIASPEGEQLLHWVLAARIDSETARTAAQRLVEHHATSPTSVRKLLHYAQLPAGFTPLLFDGFAKDKLPAELAWIVETCDAVHQKSLLLIADEIAADDDAALRMRSMLGKALTEQLSQENLADYEARVIEAFASVSTQHGERNIGGLTVAELAEGSLFTIRHLRLGKTADKLSGMTVDGEKIDLADHRGRVVLVDFWATWCVPCVTALPELTRLRDDVSESQLAIIGVSGDTNKPRLSKFIEEHALAWPNIFDRNGVLQKRWQAMSLPSYFVLDENLVVRYRGENHHAAIEVAKSLAGASQDGGGRSHARELANTILRALDANQDKRIDVNEIPEEMREQLLQADLDKNSSLSLSELTEALANAETTTESAPATTP